MSANDPNSSSEPNSQATTSEIPLSMKINMVLRLIIFPPIMALFILWPAGDWFWLNGWLFIGFFSLIATTGGFWLMNSNPELFIERMKGSYQKNQAREDSVIVTLLSVIMLGIFPIAGLDYRNKWYVLESIWYSILGWILMFISIYLLYLVMKQNTFLSRSIVVQENRNQHVIDTGLYAIVRHPMYFSIVIMLVSIGFILGSLVSFIPITLSIPLLYLRAASEEKLLMIELEGYKTYTLKVRRRLIPFLL